MMKWKVRLKRSDNLLEQLLINRKIRDKDSFFNPQISDYKKDFHIPGIPKALKRINKAIKNEELIIAYGDYDVDGICGAAVLYLGLTKMGGKALPYIPHREKEGYGLSSVGLDFARDSGAGLVISCDTGIVAFEQAQYARNLNLDLIITDHHQPDGKKRPEAFTILHTTKLCGAAVAWTLFQDEELLDLVALATVADMMPLVGINRALVKTGLIKLNFTQRVGLLALFREAGLNLGEIGSYEIGHMIAPRLNAMGRLEHAIDSLRLLCTKDQGKARRLVKIISDTNEQRKKLTEEALQEARLMIDASAKIHLLASEKWNQGIIGLVAGRICEETQRPAIAISVGEEFCKGSARANGTTNIVEIIRSCEDLLVAVGGHRGAAGFTLKLKNLKLFQQRLKSIDLPADASEKILEIEAEVLVQKLTLALAKNLLDFEPFGMGNPKPVLATYNMRLSGLRTVGDNKHLKGRAEGIDFIAFGMGELVNVLQNNQLVSVAYTLEIDHWDSQEKIQLKVKDIKT